MVVKARARDIDRIYTNEEFEALPTEYENYELFKGRLVEKMPTNDQHSRVTRRLDHAIAFFDPDEILGQTWRDATFALKPGFEPKPDLAFVVASRIPPESDTILRLAPDLVVEVWSPHDLDSANRYQEALDKVQEYLEVGVKIVWAINPKTKTVEVYHAGQATPVEILDINDELAGEDIIPGFKMKVNELFQ